MTEEKEDSIKGVNLVKLLESLMKLLEEAHR